jgi:multicomponent Na+:H+ antiporter subunit B
VSGTLRVGLFAIAACALGGVLLRGLGALPEFGHYVGPYGDVVVPLAVDHGRAIANVATAIVFDHRGFDTLGEEFIFVAGVAGVAVISRRLRDESRRTDPQEHVEAVASVTPYVLIPGLLYSAYTVFSGGISPGGGFQGGAILASVVVLAFLAGDALVLKYVAPKDILERFEGFGVSAFVGVGLAAVLAGGAYLENFLPQGELGKLASGGTLLLLSTAVGIAVSAGMLLVVHESLAQLERRTDS